MPLALQFPSDVVRRWPHGSLAWSVFLPLSRTGRATRHAFPLTGSAGRGPHAGPRFNQSFCHRATVRGALLRRGRRSHGQPGTYGNHEAARWKGWWITVRKEGSCAVRRDGRHAHDLAPQCAALSVQETEIARDGETHSAIASAFLRHHASPQTSLSEHGAAMGAAPWWVVSPGPSAQGPARRSA